MQLTSIETIGLDGPVGMGGEVALFQAAEGDGLPGRISQLRPDVWGLAVMLDEGHDVGTFRQHDQPLLQPHEQVIDLPSLVFGLVLLDLTNGKGVQLAVVAEKNPDRKSTRLNSSHT